MASLKLATKRRRQGGFRLRRLAEERDGDRWVIGAVSGAHFAKSMDWARNFYSTRSEWFGPTGIFPEHRARALDIARLCGRGSKRVLELGAGAGGTAAAMADLGYTVVAIEFSPVRAAFARDLAGGRPNL